MKRLRKPKQEKSPLAFIAMNVDSWFSRMNLMIEMKREWMFTWINQMREETGNRKLGNNQSEEGREDDEWNEGEHNQ